MSPQPTDLDGQLKRWLEIADHGPADGRWVDSVACSRSIFRALVQVAQAAQAFTHPKKGVRKDPATSPFARLAAALQALTQEAQDCRGYHSPRGDSQRPQGSRAPGRTRG